MSKGAEPVVVSQEEAVARARDLLDRTTGRVLLGIAGAPGAGKSYLSARLLTHLPDSVVVGMDAFHLAHSTLTERGMVERKGAPETFDAEGFVALLHRIRGQGDETVWAPEFRREIEDAIAGAIEVLPSHRLVITEGNYLLCTDGPWAHVSERCDEVWFVDPGEDVRVEHLVARHVRYGRTATEARRRATSGTDGQNAALVAATRHRATLVVR